MDVKKKNRVCPDCLHILASVSIDTASMLMYFCYECSPTGLPFIVTNPVPECLENIAILEHNDFLVTHDEGTKDLYIKLTLEGDEICGGLCVIGDDIPN